MSFVAAIDAAQRRNASLLCVGLDPEPAKFPAHLRGKPDAVFEFCRAIVDANLAALGVLEHISFSISLDDVAEGKPDPEPYLQACTRLHLDPASVIAIEDSRSGALSARRAGLTVIGYTATGGGFDEADHLIADFSQFMDQQQPWWR